MHGALHPEPTASGACDMEFWSKRGRRRRRNNKKRKKEKRRNCTFVKI